MLGVLTLTDLSPRVEADFFFSRDDPQLRASRELADRFPSSEQVIIRSAAPDVRSDTYVESVSRLADDLDEIEGVRSVNSIASEDASGSPLWRRILLNDDASATNLIINIDSVNPAELAVRLEEVVAEYASPEFRLDVSGVPYVTELIRRNLYRDLVVFSSTAFLVFGIIIALVYRKVRLVLGTLAACLTACSVTLTLTHIFSIGIGILTANIAVIVFVLTLSHTVFLTANWKLQFPANSSVAVRTAVRMTGPASFWCMVTTLLGFLSLLITSAKPLRDLGVAGAIGTLTAFVVAYTFFPFFLRNVGHEPAEFEMPAGLRAFGRWITNTRWWLIPITVFVLIAAIGVARVNTDPSLLSYFAPNDPLRSGLEAIDRDGGSSPLSVVVQDTDGQRIDTDAVNDKMWTLQERLEDDAAVGAVISPAVILEHARTMPFGGLLSWSQLLDILESPLVNRVARAFVSDDRHQARFLLRMRESGRAERRADVIARIEQHVQASGLEVALLAGQYDLQRQLGTLISTSIRIGLTALIAMFVVIAFVTSRSLRATVAMVGCLAAIPLVVLGIMGHFAIPVDIITSPAANIALAMGVDSMIHLAIRARSLAQPVILRDQTTTTGDEWFAARAQLWKPVVSATVIISVGFGIFGLSSFPPTQRFGLAVIVGTLTAATMALVALPLAARPWTRVKR